MSDILGPSTTAMTQGITLFSNFLPSLSDIRKADPVSDPEFAADVRMGEAAATIVLVGVGAMISSLAGNATPIVVALITAGLLVCLYEYTLTGRRFSATHWGEVING